MERGRNGEGEMEKVGDLNGLQDCMTARLHDIIKNK
jgi:hypothetical protein